MHNTCVHLQGAPQRPAAQRPHRRALSGATHCSTALSPISALRSTDVLPFAALGPAEQNASALVRNNHGLPTSKERFGIEVFRHYKCPLDAFPLGQRLKVSPKHCDLAAHFAHGEVGSIVERPFLRRAVDANANHFDLTPGRQSDPVSFWIGPAVGARLRMLRPKPESADQRN